MLSPISIYGINNSFSDLINFFTYPLTIIISNKSLTPNTTPEKLCLYTIGLANDKLQT